MADQRVFKDGRGILVTTHGPGKLHLYTYFPDASAKNIATGYQGALETHNHGVTRFMIGKSYTFTHFGFYWEGHGQAEYSVGPLPEKHKVGRSWSDSSFFNTTYLGVLPVEITPPYFAGSVNLNGNITCYRIPDHI